MAGTATIEHAKLLLYEATSKGPGAEQGTLVTFQFNPKELSIKKAAKWENKASKSSKKTSMPEYKGPDPQTLSVECFLDATDNDNPTITDTIDKLFACCCPDPKSLSKNQPSPPFVVLTWGKFRGPMAHLKSVEVKYTFFRPDGTPIRAVATIELQEVSTEPGKQNPTSGTLEANSTHTVVSGDSLQSIATAEYGNPNRWRAIAVRNGITDPLRLRPGTRLLIPSADEARGLS